jgi:hypothetical protein
MSTTTSAEAPARAWAGVAAPVVWLGGALVMSYDERSFMDRLGWDVWPSGLALGPHGWAQIGIFLVFAVLYLFFMEYVSRRGRWSRLSRWGSRLALVFAASTVLLAFKTDPMNQDMTWHGTLHAIGYAALLLSMLTVFVSVYPGLLRGRGRWRLAPLGLVLIPFAWLAPNDKATSNYLFFAIPFTLLAALALTLVATPADA